MLVCLISSGQEAAEGTVDGSGPESSIPPGEDGFIITLEVLSGIPDPQWTIQQNDPRFSEVQNLYRDAKKHSPDEAPAKLGYEGFIVQEVRKGQYQPLVLIVGPKTKQLQLLLLQTSPQDKVSTDLNHIVQEEIRSGNVKAVKRNRVKRYAPPYTPETWNRYPDVLLNNCYNYASTKETDTFAQPGRATNNSLPWPFTGADARASSESDGCVFVTAETTMSAPSGDEHLAALFVSTRVVNDYHWYRLDNNGYWSHKPGQTPATNLDGDGNRIRDPRNAANGLIPYEFVCFMKINRNTLKIA
ncbi:Insoluble matrix shell protein 1 [Stylophora pistillata]|uniref:Insoluble matrix shell protein 1 n=1 Tax=Stylophora pistillata TaxID=50429 RepID=A0A2B4SPW7_STYPI|nr:Insoluble matrix shell protein 1 [Stylophora pistillata]